MCGIAGYIGKLEIDKPRIIETLALMKNRGPDNLGFEVIKNQDLRVVLLHSRLGIIDLDKRANQPFKIGEYTIIFNGEIYNYVEIRNILQNKGFSFRTDSDTEVLLQAYIAFGQKCVEYFEGMWSFVIFNQRNSELFLSRDRFAEKPLFFLETSEGIFFGSEIKFIKSLSATSLTVNLKHIFRYLVNGYKSLYKVNETFFEDIKEIPFATNAIIKQDLHLHLSKYWQPVSKIKQITLTEAIDGFRQRLLESIKIRLRADVPMAFCLSGGVDSAALVSIAAKHFNYNVSTFSIIDKDERYNESVNIKATVEDVGCKSTLINIPTDKFFSRLDNLIEYHDAPVYTISYYIHSFLSEAVSKNGFRLVASGTGADELVTGYYDHFNLFLYEMRKHSRYQDLLSDWKKHISPVLRNPYLKNPELYSEVPEFRNHIYLNNNIFSKFLKVDFKEEFAETLYCDSFLRNRMMNELFHESIPVILHEDDLNSMFYSVENRSPYLDSKLFDFSYSIPIEYLIRDGYGKFILRESVKGILNEKVRTDRQKKGFNASINSLVDFNDKENREKFLEDGKIFEYVERDEINKILLKDPMPNSYSKFLFYFLSAKLFLERFG